MAPLLRLSSFALIAICISGTWGGVWGAVLAYDLACALSIALLFWFGIRALKKHNLRLDFRNALQEGTWFRREMSVPRPGMGSEALGISFWCC
jgi:hypothetical protein